MSFFGSTAPRLTLVNIANRQRMEVQFNPTELQTGLSVNYERLGVVGMSHQPLQYINTSNVEMPLRLFSLIDADLEIDRQPVERTNANGAITEGGAFNNGVRLGRVREQVRSRERFLQALCYPTGLGGNVRTGGPPRVLVVWPRYLSMTCVVTRFSTRASRFNRFGDPVVLTHEVGLEEIRDVRLTSSEVLTNGWQRSQAPPNLEDLI